jgi:hypothetical protein
MWARPNCLTRIGPVHFAWFGSMQRIGSPAGATWSCRGLLFASSGLHGRPPCLPRTDDPRAFVHMESAATLRLAQDLGVLRVTGGLQLHGSVMNGMWRWRAGRCIGSTEMGRTGGLWMGITIENNSFDDLPERLHSFHKNSLWIFSRTA